MHLVLMRQQLCKKDHKQMRGIEQIEEPLCKLRMLSFFAVVEEGDDQIACEQEAEINGKADQAVHEQIIPPVLHIDDRCGYGSDQ